MTQDSSVSGTPNQQPRNTRGRGQQPRNTRACLASYGRMIQVRFQVLAAHWSLYFGFGVAMIHTVTFTFR